MENHLKLFTVKILLIIVCCGCQNNQQPHLDETSAKITLSFEDFEEIAENQPEQYLNNPDSFLNEINLIPQEDYEHEAYVYGLVYMAYNLREQGNIYRSIQYYEKALNYVKDKKAITLDVSLYILKPLATLYINVDDNKKAITLLEELWQSIPTHEYQQQLGLLNNLANAYIYNGEPHKGIAIITDKILHLKSSITKALLFNTLSKAYNASGNTANSKTYNERAIAEFDKYELRNDTLIWYCSALTQYAELNHSTKEVEKALRILNTHFPTTQYRNKANAYLSLANIHFDHNEFKDARNIYNTAFKHFQQNNNKYILDYKYTYSLLGLARSFKAENRPDSAILYYEWAIENDFRTQQLITSEVDQLRNNIWNKNIVEELIKLYEEHPRMQTAHNRATLLWCIELSKARLLINEINRSENWSTANDDIKIGIQKIRLLYQHYDATTSEQDQKAILEQINKFKTEFQLSESYFETINFNPSKSKFLETVQLKENAYYSYYIQKDSSISIVYTNVDQLTYKTIKDPSFIKKLNTFKSSYFSNSPNNFNNNPDKYIQSAKAFKKQLLPNLNNEKNQVFLSLDGDLYGLPFDALYDHDYLVHTHNFAYLNSFLLFDFITNKDYAKTKEISLIYRAEFPKPLPHLAFVQKEVETLTTKFQTSVIAPNHQNDSTIREAFTRTNIIHIAAHTVLDSTKVPYLYLHQIISTNQLRFFEIKTPLVFLSACNTGSGVALPSEGTESIQRVFLSKNVPSVISTYWFANDEVMLKLTSKFYDELLDSQNPMHALAQAKREFLQQANSLQQNPWYWANINYTGVGNKVGLKTTSNLPIAILGLIIFVLIAYFIYLRYSRSDVKPI